MKSELIAVVIELPIVLGISWKISAWIVCNQHISFGSFDRSIIMGLIAFCLLMSAEFLLAMQAFDKTPADFVNELTSSTPQIVGLSGTNFVCLLSSHPGVCGSELIIVSD